MKVSRSPAVDPPRVTVRKPLNMTPKVSCLNFGVQSLFDSKSSNVKNLPKFRGGKCGQSTDIVQELAIKKRHQAYRIAAIVQNAPMKSKS